MHSQLLPPPWVRPKMFPADQEADYYRENSRHCLQ